MPLLAAAVVRCAPPAARTAGVAPAAETTVPAAEHPPGADAWVVRLRVDSAGRLHAETVQPPVRGCTPLVLPAGDAAVWIAALDSTCMDRGSWGPFAPGSVAGGLDAPALVLATSPAAEHARSADPHLLQLVRGDPEWPPDARLYRPADGGFAVVESGPTRVVSHPGGRTRALLHYQLGHIGFSASLSRWAGIRSDESLLNRVVILDAAGQVLHESIVAKAVYDAGRVFGSGRWMDWIGIPDGGEAVRVVADLAGPAVRTAALPPGWQHRTASPNGLYVLAHDGARLILYRDTHPDLAPAIVWSREESAVVQDEAVRDDGLVAYHAMQRPPRGEPLWNLVGVMQDGRGRTLTAPAAAGTAPRPGLRWSGPWLIEGLRAPLGAANERMIVLHDLQN